MKKFKSIAIEYLMIIVGAIIAGVSIAIFLVPFHIAAGGLSGLATVIYYATNEYVSIGVTIVLLNIPLVIIGLKVFGLNFILKTVVGLVLMSTTIDVMEMYTAPDLLSYLMVDGVTPDLLLYSIVGGVLMGAGLGLCIKGNATSGGSDLLAMILAKKNPKFTPGNMLLYIDMVIILLAMIVFRSIMLGLYGLISLFISTKVIDFLVEGAPNGKVFYIISDRSQEIGEEIMSKYGRGVTFLYAYGAYRRVQQNIIMCTVYRGQVQQIKTLVKSIDNEAFIILTDAREVLGKGFRD